jgi:hypothetical protein
MPQINLGASLKMRRAERIQGKKMNANCNPNCGFLRLRRRLIAASLLSAGFMVLLQPQMKKYRCLWCLSTPNHNI